MSVTMLCPADRSPCASTGSVLLDLDVLEDHGDDEGMRLAGVRKHRIERSRCLRCGARYVTAIEKMGHVRPAGS